MTRHVLFSATRRGRFATVRLASAAELATITRPPSQATSRDVLRPSTLVALRFRDAHDVEIVTVHALGWRVGLVNAWITSKLIGIDPDRTVVATSSGHLYALDEHQDTEPTLQLLDHLGYALRTWGFDDVRVG